MYVVLNVPAGVPRRWVLRRRFGRPFRSQQPLCQFAQCDDNATSGDIGRPLCALHHSLIEEIQQERRQVALSEASARYHGA